MAEIRRKCLCQPWSRTRGWSREQQETVHPAFASLQPWPRACATPEVYSGSHMAFEATSLGATVSSPEATGIMTSSSLSTGQGLSGSCPCSGVSWSSTVPPSGLCFCHCRDCRSSSPTSSPILYGFFPNHAIKFSRDGLSPQSADLDTSNIVRKEEDRAIRGSCKHCGSLIYMKYHSSPDETDINMASCKSSERLERLQDPVMHIFCDDRVPEGHQAWTGFSDGQKQRLDEWEKAGRKNRRDI